MLVTMLSLPPLIRWGKSAHIVAVPDHRRLHADATPQIGGVGMLIGFAVATAILIPAYPQIALFYASALTVFAMGLADDYRELDYRVKFVAQFAAALWVIATLSL